MRILSTQKATLRRIAARSEIMLPVGHCSTISCDKRAPKIDTNQNTSGLKSMRPPARQKKKNGKTRDKKQRLSMSMRELRVAIVRRKEPAGLCGSERGRSSSIDLSCRDRWLKKSRATRGCFCLCPPASSDRLQHEKKNIYPLPGPTTKYP